MGNGNGLVDRQIQRHAQSSQDGGSIGSPAMLPQTPNGRNIQRSSDNSRVGGGTACCRAAAPNTGGVKAGGIGGREIFRQDNHRMIGQTGTGFDPISQLLQHPLPDIAYIGGSPGQGGVFQGGQGAGPVFDRLLPGPGGAAILTDAGHCLIHDFGIIQKLPMRLKSCCLAAPGLQKCLFSGSDCGLWTEMPVFRIRLRSLGSPCRIAMPFPK